MRGPSHLNFRKRGAIDIASPATAYQMDALGLVCRILLAGLELMVASLRRERWISIHSQTELLLRRGWTGRAGNCLSISLGPAPEARVGLSAISCSEHPFIWLANGGRGVDPIWCAG